MTLDNDYPPVEGAETEECERNLHSFTFAQWGQHNAGSS
jgi:hypothetical protein